MVSKGGIEVDSIPLYTYIGYGEEGGDRGWFHPPLYSHCPWWRGVGGIEVDSIPLYIAIGHGEKRGRLRVDSIPLYIAIGHHVDVDGRLFKEWQERIAHGRSLVKRDEKKINMINLLTSTYPTQTESFSTQNIGLYSHWITTLHILQNYLSLSEGLLNKRVA